MDTYKDAKKHSLCKGLFYTYIYIYTKIGSKQGKLLENMLEIEQT